MPTRNKNLLRIAMFSLTVPLLTSVAIADESNSSDEPLPILEGGTPASDADNKITPEQVAALRNDRSSQGKVLTLPKGEGTLTSNTYRQTFATKSGNTYQWDYLVSAVYKGNLQVKEIKTTWRAEASLRSGGSINLGFSETGGSAGASSNWQTTKTLTKYRSSTNGAKSVDFRSNIVIAPARDYRSNTVSIINTSSVLLVGDPRKYTISSGA